MAIQIRGLYKKFPNGTVALHDANLQVQDGCFFTLLGPNGAGKTTLIKILTTLTRKDAGEVYIKGINPEISFSKVQRYIGVVSQDNEIDPEENVEAQLIFQGRLFGMSKKEAQLKADALIEAFHLEDKEKDKARTLSGGNMRRLHCALALVHSPSLLFLDEPTVGMDPVARSDFWKVLTALNKNEGVTVFLTTQYLEEADKHAQEMAFIIGGNVRYEGSITGFKTMVHSSEKVSLEDSYLKYLKDTAVIDTSRTSAESSDE